MGKIIRKESRLFNLLKQSQTHFLNTSYFICMCVCVCMVIIVNNNYKKEMYIYTALRQRKTIVTRDKIATRSILFYLLIYYILPLPLS